MAESGSRIGGSLANTAFGKISRIVGHGDYHVENTTVTNSLMKSGNVRSSFGNISNTRVRHREYIGDLVATKSSYEVHSFPVQPGSAQTFPVLSQLASVYTKYKMHGLVVELESQVSEFVALPSMGKIAVTFDPNQGSAPPVGMAPLLNMCNAVESKPSRNLIYPIECDPKSLPYNEYFIRVGDTPYQAGVAEDMGVIYVATNGLPSSYFTDGPITLAAIWVTYDVELDTIRESELPPGNYFRGGSAAANGTGSPAISYQPFGTPTVSVSQNGMLAQTYIGSSDPSTPDYNDAIFLRGVEAGSIVLITISWWNNTGSISNAVANMQWYKLVPYDVFPQSSVYSAYYTLNQSATSSTVCIAFQVSDAEQQWIGGALQPTVTSNNRGDAWFWPRTVVSGVTASNGCSVYISFLPPSIPLI